jgi:hypothetical protein
VAQRLRSIAAREARDSHVFLKIGDSNTADGAFLRCFDFPTEGPIELGDHADLEPTIEWFYGSGTQSTMTAVPGMRASDVVTGDPSALDTTLSQSPARYALVMAEEHSIPLIDQRREMDQIPNGGLSQDDIHFSVYDRGCSFTSAGLQFGFNLRNLLTYEALMRVRATLEEGVVWDP